MGVLFECLTYLFLLLKRYGKNICKNKLDKILQCSNLQRAFHQGWEVKFGGNSLRRFNGGHSTRRIVLKPSKLNSNMNFRNLAGNILLQAYEKLFHGKNILVLKWLKCLSVVKQNCNLILHLGHFHPPDHLITL